MKLLDFTGFIESEKYFAVWFCMWLETFFPVFPSELIIPLGILGVHHGTMNFYGVIAAAVAGSMTGAIMWYLIARWLGIERFGNFVTKYGRYTSLSHREVAMLQRWFDKQGGILVLVCRVVPLVRSVISIPAGLVRMPFIPFFFYTLAGSLIWTGALAYISWFFRGYIEMFHAYIGPGVKIVVVVLAAVWLYRVVTYKPEKHA